MAAHGNPVSVCSRSAGTPTLKNTSTLCNFQKQENFDARGGFARKGAGSGYRTACTPCPQRWRQTRESFRAATPLPDLSARGSWLGGAPCSHRSRSERVIFRRSLHACRRASVWSIQLCGCRRFCAVDQKGLKVLRTCASRCKKKSSKGMKRPPLITSLVPCSEMARHRSSPANGRLFEPLPTPVTEYTCWIQKASRSSQSNRWRASYSVCVSLTSPPLSCCVLSGSKEAQLLGAAKNALRCPPILARLCKN